MNRLLATLGMTILAVSGGLGTGCKPGASRATPSPTLRPPVSALDAARRAAGKGDCDGARKHLETARRENPQDSAVVALSQWVEAGCQQELPQVRRTVSPPPPPEPDATDPGYRPAPPAG